MKIKISEVVILLIVSLMAFAANLPSGTLEHSVDQKLLLGTLAATVFISLFRYLKLMLFLTVSVLTIGANLPDQLANQLGISQPAMIVASGVLVCIALLYKFYRSKPNANSGYDVQVTPSDRRDTISSRNAVLAAISNGNIASLHQLLIADVEVNYRQNGLIPLFLAIEKGYAEIVLLLIFFGAKIQVKNTVGQSPVEFALLHKEVRIAELIRYASTQQLAIQVKAEPQIQNKGKMINV